MRVILGVKSLSCMFVYDFDTQRETPRIGTCEYAARIARGLFENVVFVCDPFRIRYQQRNKKKQEKEIKMIQLLERRKSEEVERQQKLERQTHESNIPDTVSEVFE